MQSRTDGVHCRESASTGPVVLKVVPNECCQFAGHHGPINVRLSFSMLIIIMIRYQKHVKNDIPSVVVY